LFVTLAKVFDVAVMAKNVCIALNLCLFFFISEPEETLFCVGIQQGNW
jgi:hypothetical protein